VIEDFMRSVLMKGPNAAKRKMPGTNCLAYGAIAFEMNLSLNGIFVVLNLNIHCSILFLHGDGKKKVLEQGKV